MAMRLNRRTFILAASALAASQLGCRQRQATTRAAITLQTHQLRANLSRRHWSMSPPLSCSQAFF
jgi:hypothetical protein